MRLNFIVLSFWIALMNMSFFTSGQTCGTEERHKLLMQNDPVYRADYLDTRNRIFEILENTAQKVSRSDDSVYTIPVVVHIIHTGTAIGKGANMTDFQVLSAIQGLNDKFANKIGSSLDIGIQFCLATTDPDGCPTTGINRIDASFIPKYKLNGIAWNDTLGADDKLIKDLSKWPVSQYYNIWVVSEISPPGIAGYAYYPNGNPYDGTVIAHTWMKYDDKTLAHEVGHGLFLKHTFDGDGGNSNCPDDNDCKFDGDMICDTPPHKQGDCDEMSSCLFSPLWNNSRFNYMSYCFPDVTLNRFTPNQRARMRAVLLDDIRNPLLHSNGCQPSSFNSQVSKIDATCPGACNGSINIDPSCPSTYKYVWSNGDTLKNITNLCPGKYTVTITNDINITSVVTVDVGENPLPVVDAGQDAIIAPGNSVKIGGVPTAVGVAPFFYKWTPVDGLNSPLFSNPIASPTVTTKYYINVTDKNGCSNIDSVTVTVSSTGTTDHTNLSNLLVYPNPTQDLLNISSTKIDNGEYKLSLKNMLGQSIYEESISVGNNELLKQISLANISGGFYLLELSNETSRSITKVRKYNK